MDITVNLKSNVNELINSLNSVQESEQKIIATTEKVEKSLDNVFKKPQDQVTTALEKQKEALSEIDQELKDIAISKKKAFSGEALKNLEKYEKELLKERDALLRVTQATGTVTKATLSLRTELRKTIAEMAQLDLAGKRDSNRYRELSLRAGELKDAIADATTTAKNLGSDTRNIEGLMQGVQGAIGAYSVFSGVLALTGSESENLQRIEKQMQSLMTVMIGLQQIQNLVQKESAFMQLLMSVREKALLLTRSQSTAAITAETAALEANNLVSENAASGIDDVSNSLTKVGSTAGTAATGITASTSAIALGAAAAIAALAGLVYGMVTFNENQEKVIEDTDEWKSANDALNTSLLITFEQLNDNIKQVSDYITELRKRGKTQEQLTAEQLTQIKKEGEALSQAFLDKAKQAEFEKVQLQEQLDALKQRRIISREDEGLTLEERTRITQLENTIRSKTKAVEENNKAAQETLNRTYEGVAAVDELIKAEKQEAETREAARKAAEDKRTAYQRLIDSISALEIKIRDQITLNKEVDEQDLRLLRSLQNRKQAIDDLNESLTKLQKMEVIKLSGGNELVKSVDNISKEISKLLSGNKAITIDVELALPNKLEKADTPYTDLFKDSGKEAGQDWIDGFLEKILQLGTDDISQIRDSLEGLVSTLADSLTQILDSAFEADIKAYDEFISKQDELIAAQEDRLQKQIELNKEGAASNIKIEQERLKDLKEARDKAIADREKQVQKEKNLERTMAVVKAAAAATEVIASAVETGGAVGAIVGIVEALALIATIATLFSNADSSIKYAQGTAEILGGRPHSQGGTSLGQYGEAEKGEFLGILSKSKTAKYGDGMLKLFEGLNQNDKVKAEMGLLSIASAGSLQGGSHTSEVILKEIPEIKGIYNEVRKQGKTVTYGDGYRIEKFGNVTRKILN